MLRWLSELTDKDNAEVGPKIARLGSLRANGIEVPDGFAITTAAFERFLAGNDLALKVERELESAPNIDNLVEVEVASLRVRELIEQAPNRDAPLPTALPLGALCGHPGTAPHSLARRCTTAATAL